MTYFPCATCGARVLLDVHGLPKHRTPWGDECTSYAKYHPPRLFNGGSPGSGKRS